MGALHIILLLVLNSCTEVPKIGNRIGDLIQGIGQYAQTSGINQAFTTLKGHVVSFSKKDGHRVAMVDEQLPLGFIHKVVLPVYFGLGFSLERLAACSTEEQRKLINIMPTSSGRIIYVGSQGLLGGLLEGWQNCSIHKKEKYKYCEKGLPGFRRGSYECFQCGYAYKASIARLKDSFAAHFCNNEGCDNCLEKYKSTCFERTRKKHCNVCCDHEDRYYDQVTRNCDKMARKMSRAFSMYKGTRGKNSKG